MATADLGVDGDLLAGDGLVCWMHAAEYVQSPETERAIADAALVVCGGRVLYAGPPRPHRAARVFVGGRQSGNSP